MALARCYNSRDVFAWRSRLSVALLLFDEEVLLGFFFFMNSELFVEIVGVVLRGPSHFLFCALYHFGYKTPLCGSLRAIYFYLERALR